jgi:hypothetical protein
VTAMNGRVQIRLLSLQNPENGEPRTADPIIAAHAIGETKINNSSYIFMKLVKNVAQRHSRNGHEGPSCRRILTSWALVGRFQI